MWHTFTCVIEVIILVIVAKILIDDRGMFDSNPPYMSSNPGVAAAIGNAANRHFENSQCNVGGCMSNKGLYHSVPSGPSVGFPQVTRGFATNKKGKFMPERLINY